MNMSWGVRVYKFKIKRKTRTGVKKEYEYIIVSTKSTTGASQSEPVPHRRVKTPHYYVDCARWICSSWLIVSRFVYQSTSFMTIECEILFCGRRRDHMCVCVYKHNGMTAKSLL